MMGATRLLIVDDHPAMRDWVRSKLHNSDHLEVVEEAADGHEAVAKAQTVNPDLVLLDIGMPGLNGMETAALLRQLLPRTKIIFLSQNSDPDVIAAALSDGVNGFVSKCKAERELIPAIQAVLRGEIFSSNVL